MLVYINWWDLITGIFEWVFAFMWLFFKIMLIFWPLWLIASIFIVLKIFLKDGKLNNNYIDNQITKASTDSKYYATKYSRLLCDELMRRGIEPIMEYNDGHKTIDIAILPARLYIEIDGIQHLNNPNQIIKDLKRDYHSYEEGFYTIRIPNQVLENHLGGIADAIAEVVKNSRNL